MAVPSEQIVRVALFFIGVSPLFAKEKDPVGSFVAVQVSVHSVAAVCAATVPAA